MKNKNNTCCPWKLSDKQRKSTSRKYKETEKAIKRCKMDGDWFCVLKLRSLLRRVWWGIKRYKGK